MTRSLSLLKAIQLLLLIFWASTVCAFAAEFERLDGCRLIENIYNDGDSFRVQHAGKEYVFRLYFVDTPETRRYVKRSQDQAAYFSISSDEAIYLGKKASAFTENLLSGTFTVYTRWRKALGRGKLPRYYALVKIGEGDLAELLVKNGLARNHGMKTALPDGRDSQSYLLKLSSLEEKAKSAGHGGWKASLN